MKRILCIVGCFAMGWVALPAHAQLGKLKEKLKEAVPNDKKSPDSRNADLSKDGQRKERFDANAQKDNAVKLKKSEEEGKTKLNSSNFDREAYEKRVYSKLDLDFSTQPFMPTITMQSLLSDECLMYNAVKGELRISGLEVGFLPTRTKDGQEVNYSPILESNTDKFRPPLRADVIEKGTGKLKGQQFFKAEIEVAPFYKLKVVNQYSDYFPFWVNVTEGDYELRFYVGTTHFYTFPFKIEKKSNPDPYSPVKDFYFLRGAWEEWGTIELREDEMVFNHYLTDRNAEVKSQANWDESRPYEAILKLSKDGKVIGACDIDNEGKIIMHDAGTRHGVWRSLVLQIFAFPVTPKNTTRRYLKPSELKDGTYQIELSIKDPKGKISTEKYGFTMKAGKIVPHPKADHAIHKDHLTFLEQGTKCSFIKKM